MNKETIVNSRPDREIRKTVITPGDYSLVPFEESRCKFIISDKIVRTDVGDFPLELTEPTARVFSKSFNGIVIIGDSDHYIDRDFELVLQQMCCGETCSASFVYKDSRGRLVTEICCKIELVDVTEEQLISDWGWVRLYEAALHHKEKGIELIHEKKMIEAFRRFSKALKFIIAIEPIDPEVIDEATVKELIEVKVKLYNNLAHCQLQFNEYEAAIDLCNRALKYDPLNLKALYRRCLGYSGCNLLEDARKDIQEVLRMDPKDKAAQRKAALLKRQIENINKSYKNVIQKMFSSP